MNFFTSADEIINLPISEKERNHHSRDRHAYHVYLSRFCKRYQSLNDREKREVLEQLGVWRIQQHAGYDSDDSIVSVPKASSGQLMKATGRVWRDYTTLEMKDAWRERTRRLNELPVVDGTFDYVPCAVGGEDTEHLEKNTMHALTLDWQQLVQLLKMSLFSNMRNVIGSSQTSYKFGNERVVLYTQCYRKFYMSYLMKLTLFGFPLYTHRLEDYEMPYRYKKERIIHIYSHERFCELFSYGGLNAGVHIKNGLKYMICSKVNLRRGRRNIIGYVMDEDDIQLHIKIEGEENNILLDRPRYDSHDGKFIYPRTSQGGSYLLTQLWPIRIKLNESGQSSYIISYCTQTFEEEVQRLTD